MVWPTTRRLFATLSLFMKTIREKKKKKKKKSKEEIMLRACWDNIKLSAHDEKTDINQSPSTRKLKARTTD